MQPAQALGSLGWHSSGFPELGSEVSPTPSEDGGAEVEYWGDQLTFRVQPRYIPCSPALNFMLVKSVRMMRDTFGGLG